MTADAVPPTRRNPHAPAGRAWRLVSEPGPRPRTSASAVPLGGGRERSDVQGCRAGFVTRSLANAVDFCLVVVVLVLGWLAVAALRFLAHTGTFHFPGLGIGLLVVVGELLLAAYFAVCWSLTGRTYGDAVLGLRVADGRGRRIGWPVAIARAVLCVVFPLGLLWVLVSSRNRSLQDVVLRTSVVYDWTDPHPRSLRPEGTPGSSR